MKRSQRIASFPYEMTRPPLFRRAVVVALAAVLAACSSSPRPRAQPPVTLAEVNLALSWHFAEVTLTNDVVLRGLRGVEVTPERLRWANESGQRREIPIAEVSRIVLRGRDPEATPPTEGAKLLAGAAPSSPEPTYGTPVSGSFRGDSAVVAGALYGVLYLAAAGAGEPGVLIYEAPVTRYLATTDADRVGPDPEAVGEELPPPG